MFDFRVAIASCFHSSSACGKRPARIARSVLDARHLIACELNGRRGVQIRLSFRANRDTPLLAFRLASSVSGLVSSSASAGLLVPFDCEGADTLRQRVRRSATAVPVTRQQVLSHRNGRDRGPLAELGQCHSKASAIVCRLAKGVCQRAQPVADYRSDAHAHASFVSGAMA
jgi:hypothetical protein